jgi:hypothetical protein
MIASRPILLASALFVAIALAAIAPIRSYDLGWHLATGRWIIEHRALPLTDPFTVASDRVPWINGEWLFDVAIAPVQRLVGFAGLSIVRALLVALLFTAALLAARETDITTAYLATAVSFAGANRLLDLRPASVAPLFAVGLIAAARRSWILIAIITALWINIHPSALLAPIIVVVMTRSIPKTAASLAALLVNPFGWRAITAPITLGAFATSGAFVNAEWLPSWPAVFPLFYATLAIALLCFVAAREERRPWQLILFALFALLAIRHVRHQPLYFATLPLLMPRFRVREVQWLRAAAFVPIAWIAFASDHTRGLAPHRFPVASVARLKATGLPGDIYNADQFGGYLIYRFYPQRRALTDGRNELYRTYLREYAAARLNNIAWRELLRKYRVDLAVDEYRRGKIEVVDAVTRRKRSMPASLLYWPRDEWALIAYDDVAMVFARRAAYSKDVIERWEMRGVLPDGSS